MLARSNAHALNVSLFGFPLLERLLIVQKFSQSLNRNFFMFQASLCDFVPPQFVLKRIRTPLS